MAVWTEELKAELIEAYLGKDPTPETTSEIVKELAADFSGTVNSIRMTLNKAGVYVKTVPKATTTGADGAPAAKRVSKADSIESLTQAIQAKGLEVDEAILSKLTGKAAIYFTGLIAMDAETETDD